MALRAGYYGIKKNVLSAISGLSGAKIIKTIGDGLKLTAAGKLSCDIDSETMEFKSGKLSAKIPTIEAVKTITYTGDGTGTSTIDFSALDELPKQILGITGQSASGYYVSTTPIIYGVQAIVWAFWLQVSGSSTQAKVNRVTYTDDNKKMHITGANADEALNSEGVTWTVHYI